MCTNINVNLPTVVSFLMLYSLRCGSIVILIWTVLRSLATLIFFVNAIMYAFLPDPDMGVYVMPKYMREVFYSAFVVQVIIIVTESFVFVYCLYLGMGLYYDSPSRIKQYLVCRFITWMSETFCLVVESLMHHDFTGWYLLFLMSVILEFYGFIVVYSYYQDMVEEIQKYEMGEMMDSSLSMSPGASGGKGKKVTNVCDC